MRLDGRFRHAELIGDLLVEQPFRQHHQHPHLLRRQRHQAIARVLQGEVWTPPDVDLQRQADAETVATIARLSSLTPQQVRVLMMLSGGLLNKQIAYELGVSEATVKAHVSAILQKLGVESRTQAVIAAGRIEVGQWPQVPARET